MPHISFTKRATSWSLGSLIVIATVVAPLPAHSAADATAQKLFESGVQLKNKRQFRPAINLFTQAIAVNPNFAQAYRSRASCLIEIDNFDQAMTDANKAISLDPKLAFAYSDRAKIYNERGKHKEAIADLTRAIELSKDKPMYTFYQDRGSLLKESGDDKGALADFTSGLKLNPKDCWLHYFRACIYYKRGNYKDALADASEAIRTQTADEKGAFYQMRAKCYDKLGQPALAKKDRDTADAAVGFVWGEK